MADLIKFTGFWACFFGDGEHSARDWDYLSTAKVVLFPGMMPFLARATVRFPEFGPADIAGVDVFPGK
ncbi:MAG: hypothetical protein QNK37_25015 [Acidobacteriota bacterium]|nr:hypothetical protein [Acidobacteriota bacterium]